MTRTRLLLIALLAFAGCEPNHGGVTGVRGLGATHPPQAPDFIWGTGGHPGEPAETPAQAARRHLARMASTHGLRAADLEAAEVRYTRTLRSGAAIVQVGQRLRGIEVYPAEARLLLRKDLDLAAIAGRLRPMQFASRAPGFTLSPAAALARALSAQLGESIAEEDFRALPEPYGDWTRYALRNTNPRAHLSQPAQIKAIYYFAEKGLLPAYFLEVFAGPSDSTDTAAFRYIIDAQTGEVLSRRDLTAYDSYAYRVWASPSDYRPLDGPTVDLTPHPLGTPDYNYPSFTTPNLVTVEGLNHNYFGRADPWLAAGAVETRGNNVDAFADHYAPDGYTNDDVRATATAPGVFDHPYDTSLSPVENQTQTMASVTAMFYVNNWLHDWWYDSGFDELAGNAQLYNYERGGFGGDPMRAEAQDDHFAGRRNNANMATPSDGLSPRMQMYTWSGVSQARLTISPPERQLAIGVATTFGPFNFDATGAIVLADDGSGLTSDGCQPISNVTGAIALIDRGNCNFTIKAANAQAAGALGVIIADNRPAPVPPNMAGVDPSITIPILSILQADADALKAELLAGPITASLYRLTSPEHDGGLDHPTIAHEWGHFFHHRLADCGLLMCRRMSEGFGDFVALHLIVREGDDFAGSYSDSTYASLYSGGSYFGIRRMPYSTDPAKNGLTYRHIRDNEPLPLVPLTPDVIYENSELHNSGEIWASMLFEAYVDLLRTTATTSSAVSFDEVRRTMSDYLVAGLQLTPLDSTFLEGRDAILAVAAASSPQDLQVIARAFARRGAGTCAISPDRNSPDNEGVVESFEVKPRLALEAMSLGDELRSCDGDGLLDAGERGRLSIRVGNPAPGPLAAATLTVTSSSAGVSFPAGATLIVPRLDAFESTELELEVAIDPTVTGTASLELDVEVASLEACDPVVTSTLVARINVDRALDSSTDEVESDRSSWTASGAHAGDVWSRTEPRRFDRAWHGADLGIVTDTSLESPPLAVSSTAALIIGFEHRFSFEVSTDGAGVTTYWDGGVIELSRDGGATWIDIADFVDPGYGGALTDISGNPLYLRDAFVATNPSWPARDVITLDLGALFAGETISLRFRIGTDGAAGDYGWELDRLIFSGITNAPFYRIIEDAAQCRPALIPNAGADQLVDPGVTVVLDGSSSESTIGLPFQSSWTQIAGAPVHLANQDAPIAAFTAPVAETEQTLSFRLTVNDGTNIAEDTIDVRVLAVPPPVIVADAGADQTAASGELIVLDGSGSTAGVTHTWLQTAGTGVALSGANGAVARFTAPALSAVEVLRFELTVSDGVRVATDSIEVTVTAEPVPALDANAGADQAVDHGAAVLLDGSGSSSSANLPLAFAWTQVSGPAVAIDRASSAIATFVAPSPEAETTLVFALQLGDGERTDGDEVSITVRAKPAVTVTAQAEATPASAAAGALIVLDGSQSESSDRAPLAFAWRQTSGPTVSLTGADRAVATLTAPSLDTGVTLSFELTVSAAGAESATANVSVAVGAKPGVIPPPAAEGGCGCNAARSASSTPVGVIFLVAFAWIRRRRGGVRARPVC